MQVWYEEKIPNYFPYSTGFWKRIPLGSVGLEKSLDGGQKSGKGSNPIGFMGANILKSFGLFDFCQVYFVDF